MNLNDIVGLSDGFFLLFLAVSGNYIAEIMGCEVQYYFTNNRIFKQFIVFLLIYFTINFTDKLHISPLENFKKSITLWIFFTLFTKMDITFTLISIFILLSIFIIEKQKQYEILKTKTDKKTKDYDNIQQKLLVILMVIVTVGFLRYFFSKKREYKSKFNILTFFTGIKKCKSIKTGKLVTT